MLSLLNSLFFWRRGDEANRSEYVNGKYFSSLFLQEHIMCCKSLLVYVAVGMIADVLLLTRWCVFLFMEWQGECDVSLETCFKNKYVDSKT